MKILNHLTKCLMILLLSLPLAVAAQEDMSAQSVQALKRLAAKYQESPYLSFSVLYRYNTENNPGQYLDTLRGQYKLHGNKYWSILDQQESVCDASLQLTIFREDNILYLSKAASPGQAVNPLAMLDSLLAQGKDNHFTYNTTKQEEVVSISLAGNGPCRKITWHIDRKSGWLTLMESQMRADQLFDPAIRSQVADGTSSYVNVETLYQQYQTASFDERLFDLSKYIRKEASGYSAVAPYEGYKVFLGSPGL